MMSSQINRMMEERSLVPCLQFSTDSVQSGSGNGSSPLSLRNLKNRGISFSLEDAVVIDSMYPLIDTDSSGQVILSGLYDQNSTLFDGVQLAALVIEQPEGESGGTDPQSHVALECDSITDVCH